MDSFFFGAPSMGVINDGYVPTCGTETGIDVLLYNMREQLFIKKNSCSLFLYKMMMDNMLNFPKIKENKITQMEENNEKYL